MRARIENWITGHWYTSARPPWYLRVLESVYALVGLRLIKGATGGDKLTAGGFPLTVPLIVVGNITAGGTGKTPLLIGLCRLARELGLKPGIISKGYARRDRSLHDVHPDSSVEVCGDEPVLLAKRCSVPVAVASDRSAAITRLCELGVNLVFSDDGLQQADLPRSMEICVVDGVRGIGNGHLLPAGPLREPLERLTQVDHVLTNGKWNAAPPGLATSLMTLQASTIRSVDETTEMPIDEFKREHQAMVLHAVAGIGHPQRFFAMLEGLGFRLMTHAFADHHTYRRKDFAKIGATEILLMTEKDALNCRHLALKNAWYLPVEAQLPETFEHQFKEQLIHLMAHKI